ncbi:hypothetical protein IQ254_07195 [Nodosilinea sp. LEGE 07088]|uniref:hypothetical protein n=1 Tax=Nodosilinea sp. LEGE 07088 TaxID=2777968 RepID=UPI00188213C8|nr:hypothetical protein [Nodosilinea sp. LEGE 07088]MBE9136989.1 hypothetical protein [Nodosilinea sp. LEGE 07088]
MASSLSHNPIVDIQAVMTTAIDQGVLSRRDHLTLSAAILSNPMLTLRDRQHINRIFDSIRAGRIRLAD